MIHKAPDPSTNFVFTASAHFTKHRCVREVESELRQPASQLLIALTRRTLHEPQSTLLGKHRPFSRPVGLCWFRLFVRQSAGGPRLRPRGISAATPHHARHCQTFG